MLELSCAVQKFTQTYIEQLFFLAHICTFLIILHDQFQKSEGRLKKLKESALI